MLLWLVSMGSNFQLVPIFISRSLSLIPWSPCLEMFSQIAKIWAIYFHFKRFGNLFSLLKDLAAHFILLSILQFHEKPTLRTWAGRFDLQNILLGEKSMLPKVYFTGIYCCQEKLHCPKSILLEYNTDKKKYIVQNIFCWNILLPRKITLPKIYLAGI